jgi:hypothetical protein
MAESFLVPDSCTPVLVIITPQILNIYKLAFDSINMKGIAIEFRECKGLTAVTGVYTFSRGYKLK